MNPVWWSSESLLPCLQGTVNLTRPCILIKHEYI